MSQVSDLPQDMPTHSQQAENVLCRKVVAGNYKEILEESADSKQPLYVIDMLFHRS